MLNLEKKFQKFRPAGRQFVLELNFNRYGQLGINLFCQYFNSKMYKYRNKISYLD